MNRRQIKEAAAQQDRIKICEFVKKEKEEETKKFELISSLQSILSELSNEQASIQSGIDSSINEHKERLEKEMRNFAIEFKKNPSIKPPPFQIDESFMVLLSNSNLRLEEISKQIEVIDVLIQKVSFNLPYSSFSEHEKQIINILSAKSFFRSQDVASVQKMIDFCLNMRYCLELLRTYSNKFLSIMMHKIRIHKRNPKDFTVDSERFELEHQKLEELLQELSELKEEIEEKNFPFSTKSLGEFIFSIESDEFSSYIIECTQQLEVRIKEMNGTFCNIKTISVKFVETQINYRKDFVRSVNSRNYDGCSGEENDSNYYEPAGYPRKQLENFFDQIKHI
jgi:hypothetical protein